MPKLHELLAVGDQLKNQANQVRSGLADTFKSKRHLFEGKTVTFVPSGEDAHASTEEERTVQSTVTSELQWFSDIVSKALDVSYRIAKANTVAVADLVLEDGTVLAKQVPATALLELEKRTAELQELAQSIPTLDPAKSFTPDPSAGAHIYKARDKEVVRTSKEQIPLVLYPATPEHPAQTQIITKDVPKGTLTTREWSGLITPAQKADIITRIETLRRAVKTARSRANDVEVPTSEEIGKKLLAYAFGL